MKIEASIFVSVSLVVVITCWPFMAVGAESKGTSWSQPLALCKESWTTTINSALAKGRALGQTPQEEEFERMKNFDLCGCIYKKMDLIASDFDYDKANSDLVDVEEWIVKMNIHTGYRPKDHERKYFTRTLNFGDTFLTSRGLAHMECMNNESD